MSAEGGDLETSKESNRVDKVNGIKKYVANIDEDKQNSISTDGNLCYISIDTFGNCVFDENKEY